MRILGFLLVDWLFMSLIDNGRYLSYDSYRCFMLRQEIDSREYLAELRFAESYI